MENKSKKMSFVAVVLWPVWFPLRHPVRSVVGLANFLKSLIIILVFLLLLFAVLFVASSRVRSRTYDLVVERRFDVLPDMIAHIMKGEPMEIPSREDRYLRMATLCSVLDLQNDEFQSQGEHVAEIRKALDSHRPGDSIVFRGQSHSYEQLERDCASRMQWRKILWKRIKDNERLLKRVEGASEKRKESK